MALTFTIPESPSEYGIMALVELSKVSNEFKDDVSSLMRLLPVGDELRFFSKRLPDTPAYSDYFEWGVALIRAGEIVLTAKLETFHDCGLY